MELLDDRMVDRLVRGALSPEDAPRGYAGVATLLHDARTEARSATSARAEDTIAAMVAVVRGHAADGIAAPGANRRRRSKVAAGAAAGFLALFGSLTAAGALPSAAQNGLSTVLAKVGIEVPRGDDGREGTKAPKSNGTNDPSGDNDVTGEDPTTTNHGQCVSEVAGSGGEVVSEVARSDCGKDPDPGNGNGPPDGEPPGQTKDKDTTPPTHPPQSNSGGSGGSGGSNRGNGGGNGNG